MKNINNKSRYGYFLIMISIIISFYMCINDTILVPPGYDLSVDGYVISRGLIILFILNTISKIGFHLLLNKKNR